jgi:hypothetical protein
MQFCKGRGGACVVQPRCIVDERAVEANALVVELSGHDPRGEWLPALLHQEQLPSTDERMARVQGRHDDLVPFVADVSVTSSGVVPGHRLAGG